MADTNVHALDYLNVFRRRKWWLIVPALASIAVGAILVQVLPKEYKSVATLAVAAPVVSPNFVNQSSALDNQERLRALSQQLVSAPLLSRVIAEEKLAAPNDGAAINKLRRSVLVTVPDPVANTNEPRRLDTFVVAVADREPQRAQRIANRLAAVFVSENSKSRTENAEGTSAFIASQLEASETRLAGLEAALRQAKESHMGQLPEQTQANLQTLSGLRQQLESNSTALRGEQDRLSMIERQVDGMTKGATDPVAGPNGGAAIVQTPDARVMGLRRELAVARSMYTDKHPDVVALEDELQRAQRDAAADLQKPTSDRIAQLQLDPSYRQFVGDREMARLRIRDLQRVEGDLRRQIGLYQARVESAPRVEQQLVSVQRDYDLERQQYAELSSKLHASTLAENVERNRRGEQFTVLYDANLPTEPVKPVPWRVMLISVLAGLVLGGAATFAREYLDRSVHEVRELKDEFDVPVLGEIGRIVPA